MPDAVADTHALIWYLQDDKRLSVAAARLFADCEHDGSVIYIPTISVVEIIYLTEKGRIPDNILGQVLKELSAEDTIFSVIGLSLPIVMELRNVPRAAVADLPDRIIAATALYLKLPLITRDAKIQLSEISTIW